MAYPSKHAVVFVLDASPSMNQTFASQSKYIPNKSVCNSTTPSIHSDKSTRFSLAKYAMERMISTLMLQSKSNEAGVVVIQTKSTSHHLCCSEQIQDGTAPFPNITELGYGMNTTLTSKGIGMAISPPSMALFRELRQVESYTEEDVSADLVSGLIVASDALYQRTHNKRYQRQIVIITDARERIHFNLK